MMRKIRIVLFYYKKKSSILGIIPFLYENGVRKQVQEERLNLLYYKKKFHP